MNERTDRTPITLKMGVKTTREKEGTIFLEETLHKLREHRENLVSEAGSLRGNAIFQTHCGELEQFIEDRIKEGRKKIAVRIVGQAKSGKQFLQFAFTNEDGAVHSCTVHKGCLHDVRNLHPTQFQYNPVSAQVAA